MGISSHAFDHAEELTLLMSAVLLQVVEAASGAPDLFGSSLPPNKTGPQVGSDRINSFYAFLMELFLQAIVAAH